MATRFQSMLDNVRLVRAAGTFDNPDMVGLDTMPSWCRGMIKEGWVEERDLGEGVCAWYVTEAWKELEAAMARAARPMGRPRHAKARCVTVALLCPRCSRELAPPCSEACIEALPRSFDCPCGQKGIVIPTARLDALFLA